MDPKFNRSVGLIRKMSRFIAAVFAVVALSCLASAARAQSDDEAAAAISSALSGSDASADSSDASADSEAAGADYAPSEDSIDTAVGQVLELPQQIDPATFQDAAGTNNGGDVQTQDQLGSVADYEDQSAASGLAVFPGATPARLGIVLVPRTPMPGVPVLQGGPGMVPVLPLIARPGGLGPFPATSPMLVSPRGSGAMPGGWWTRSHR
ncbi:MAG TPA: hypothetical protein VEF07_10090 [Candidatus Binataceae bacterium]|nr:hypothetical protein [Candidatus Binataceae bacterium]